MIQKAGGITVMELPAGRRFSRAFPTAKTQISFAEVWNHYFKAAGEGGI